MTRTEKIIGKYLDPDADTYTDDSELIAEMRRLATLNAAYWRECCAWRYQCVQAQTENGDVDGADCRVNASMETTDAARREAGEGTT